MLRSFFSSKLKGKISELKHTACVSTQLLLTREACQQGKEITIVPRICSVWLNNSAVLFTLVFLLFLHSSHLPGLCWFSEKLRRTSLWPVLLQCLTQEDLSSSEVSFISSYGVNFSNHLLTSATLGANNLIVHTERRAARSWL